MNKWGETQRNLIFNHNIYIFSMYILYVDSTIKQKTYLGYWYVPIIGYRKNSKGSG